MAPRETWRVGLLLDEATGLLVLADGSHRSDLLHARRAAHLLGGWSLGWIELAAELPVTLWQRSDLSPLLDQGVTGPMVDPVARTALGDLRLGAKLSLLGVEKPVGLAILLDWRLPTGNARAFASDGHALAASLVATRGLGRLRVDAQAGYLLRRPGQYAQLVVHDGTLWGLGLSFDLNPVRHVVRWKAIFELDGSVPRGFDASTDRYRAPAEARLGLRAFLTRELSVEAGAGAGLGEVGYGHERWRIFLGVRWGRTPATVGGVGGVDGKVDTDGDGVPDDLDKCPLEPGPAALDGCPDRDGDGIPDREDKCPDQPGPAENNGCPVAEDEPMVQIEEEHLSLTDSVHFDTDRDTIKPESFRLLDQVAALINAHGELKRIRVEGHTDNVGPADYNKDLSQRRAASVVRYLAGQGVASERLVPVGYGLEKPVATNETALGRARNRRVAFTILGEGATP
jgi:OOP family OmpA-OmpF porin